jgi:hypothetical protein
MSIHYNPFKENRAEQMRDLWQYYVPFPGLLDDAGKPIVVEGGRGSGKTMFFLCNSWKEKLAEIKKNSQPFLDLFDKKQFIGIYYRVDTSFVASMTGGDIDWKPVFQTYFSLYILKEFLELITVTNQEINIDGLELAVFVREFSKKLSQENAVENISDFLYLVEQYLDYIEDIINGVDYLSSKQYRFVTAQRFIRDTCIEFNKLLKRNITFKIFIDEYETLQHYQQRIINTLIKHSAIPVIFNIGLKPKGMKTQKTISETEIIEAPHDYEEIILRIDDDEFKKVLKEICTKRIIIGKDMGKIPKHVSEEIESYLGQYSFDYEFKKIENSIDAKNFLVELKELIKKRAIEDNIPMEQIKDYISVLCDDAPLLNARLHFALICTKTIHTPSLIELFNSYQANSSRYQEWMHNRKIGILFLLAKECKRDKMYFGFDVFSALSANVVRYFLELCEQAFRLELFDAFDWPATLSPETQSEAAKYVSEYKIAGIPKYEPYGKELRIFTQYLGKIFYKLHTEHKSTVGEPEPNHFYTKDLSLSNELRNVLLSAIMWNVIQEGEPTKRKKSLLSPETIDYYLNKIYAPYFGISYRNQRKIQLNVSCLTGLMSGDEEKAKKAFDDYFKLSSDDVSEEPNFIYKQSDLFD